MLLLLAYHHYARRPAMLRYVGVFLSLVLGLMSKPMLVTAPLVLLLLDYWPLGRMRLGAAAANDMEPDEADKTEASDGESQDETADDGDDEADEVVKSEQEDETDEGPDEAGATESACCRMAGGRWGCLSPRNCRS